MKTNGNKIEQKRLLAYGPSDQKYRLRKLMIVKSYRSELFRIINLEAEVDEGEFPLFDLYKKHGRIVFQLFAACNGRDFSEHASGIPYLGVDSFIRLVKCLEKPSASTLASAIWNKYCNLAEDAGLTSEECCYSCNRSHL